MLLLSVFPLFEQPEFFHTWIQQTYWNHDDNITQLLRICQLCITVIRISCSPLMDCIMLTVACEHAELFVMLVEPA